MNYPTINFGMTFYKKKVEQYSIICSVRFHTVTHAEKHISMSFNLDITLVNLEKIYRQCIFQVIAFQEKKNRKKNHTRIKLVRILNSSSHRAQETKSPMRS
jgi:hypothetical protein